MLEKFQGNFEEVLKKILLKLDQKFEPISYFGRKLRKFLKHFVEFFYISENNII